MYSTQIQSGRSRILRVDLAAAVSEAVATIDDIDAAGTVTRTLNALWRNIADWAVAGAGDDPAWYRRRSLTAFDAADTSNDDPILAAAGRLGDATATCAAPVRRAVRDELGSLLAAYDTHIVVAHAHSDDMALEATFAANEFLSACTDDDLAELAGEGWGYGYASDESVRFFAGRHDTLTAIPGDGFGCQIVAGHAARWLHTTRPDVAARVLGAAPSAPRAARTLPEIVARIVDGAPAPVLDVVVNADGNWAVLFDFDGRQLLFSERAQGGEWLTVVDEAGLNQLEPWWNAEDAGIDEDDFFAADDVRSELTGLIRHHGGEPVRASLQRAVKL